MGVHRRASAEVETPPNHFPRRCGTSQMQSFAGAALRIGTLTVCQSDLARIRQERGQRAAALLRGHRISHVTGRQATRADAEAEDGQLSEGLVTLRGLGTGGSKMNWQRGARGASRQCRRRLASAESHGRATGTRARRSWSAAKLPVGAAQELSIGGRIRRALLKQKRGVAAATGGSARRKNLRLEIRQRDLENGSGMRRAPAVTRMDDHLRIARGKTLQEVREKRSQLRDLAGPRTIRTASIWRRDVHGGK